MKKRHVSRKKSGIRSLLVLCMMTAMLCGTVPVQAAESRTEDYTYTLRIFPGAQGTFDNAPALAGITPTKGSSGELVYSGLTKTDRINFDISNVTVKNAEKYRAAEIRVSGKDNQDASARRQNFSVTEDVDCVVAYTVRSANEVAFTVHYRYTDGTAAAEDSVIYGNAGETRYIGSKWVDNYYPNTYNREIVFSTDASANEYTFIYQPIVVVTPTPAPTATPAPATAGTGTATAPAATAPAAAAATGTAAAGTGTTGTGATDGTTDAGAATDTAAAAGMATTDNAGAAGETAAAGAGGEAEVETEATTPLPASPDEVPEVLDINDDEVPLANVPGAALAGSNTTAGDNLTDSGNTTDISDGDTPASGLSTGAKAGIAAAVAAAAAVIAAVLLALRKRRP